MDKEFDADRHSLNRLLALVEQLGNIKDLDALLDRVLLEARRLTSADAGSIFLVNSTDNKILNFSYIHNDTLFTSPINKYIYSSQTLPINNKSIAGYVALTGEPVILDDVYDIPPDRSFGFNRAFDIKSGYRTKSVMAVPLKTSRDKIVGVLQIINALSAEKDFVTFTKTDELVVNYFANNAAVAIERAMMTRETILRMIKMCELRDPKETGAHANRVGAYTAEIYQKWALDKGTGSDEIKKTKDLLRIAAMLHDLGKVGISDAILRKPGKLDDQEFAIMKFHCILGARFFENSTSDLDVISAEIALNHHERWDGQGYPGKIENIYDNQVQLGVGKMAGEIPISARIVALADIYDALVSRRAYKEPFPEEQTLDIIKTDSAKHFDPEVVEAFFAIYEVIVAIREKYQEEPS